MCDPTVKLKLLVIGNTGVGKTCLIQRFVSDRFTDQSPTIGVDFMSRTVEIGDRHVQVCLWDLAGQERFHSLSTSYFRQADGCIMLFDSTRKETYDAQERWMATVQKDAPEHCITVLGATKCDQRKQRFFTEGQHEVYNDEVVQRYDYRGYFETSAATGHGIQNAVRTLCVLVLREKKARQDQERSHYYTGAWQQQQQQNADVVIVRQGKKRDGALVNGCAC